MTRLLLLAAFIGSMAITMISMTGCTNTVRGLGRDFNSDHMQNYNSRTASDAD